MELYRRVDEVLRYLWDPIGVSGVPEARDEYHAYLPHVFSLLIHEADKSQIVDFLIKTETETMGLSNTPHTREGAEEITAIFGRLSQVHP